MIIKRIVLLTIISFSIFAEGFAQKGASFEGLVNELELSTDQSASLQTMLQNNALLTALVVNIYSYKDANAEDACTVLKGLYDMLYAQVDQKFGKEKGDKFRTVYYDYSTYQAISIGTMRMVLTSRVLSLTEEQKGKLTSDDFFVHSAMMVAMHYSVQESIENGKEVSYANMGEGMNITVEQEHANIKEKLGQEVYDKWAAFDWNAFLKELNKG